MFHPRAILHIFGMLMLLNGLFMATILPVSWFNGDGDFNPILQSSISVSILGFLVWFFTRNVKKEL